MHLTKSKYLPLLEHHGDKEAQAQDKSGTFLQYCQLTSVCFASHLPLFREHNPALWQPPRCPAHDRAGERQDRPGPQPGREQGPLPHECVCGGNRPQRGGRQRRTYGCGGRAAGGKIWLITVVLDSSKQSWQDIWKQCVKFYIFVSFQINGQVLYGHTHQNASSIIKSSPSKVKIIFIRYKKCFKFPF